MTYEKAKQLLDSGHTKASRESRKLCYSCRLERRENGAIAVKQHATDIITLYPDGRAVARTGGWYVVTTKLRLNDYLPFGRIYSERGTWYVQIGGESGQTYAFADEMTFHPDGTITGAANETEIRDRAKLRNAAVKYAREFTERIARGEIAAPGAGDCWFCMLRDTNTGKGWGELRKDTSAENHIRLHIAEGYFVPSLAFNAVEAFANAPYWQTALAVATHYPGTEEYKVKFGESEKEVIRRAIRRYVLREIGLAA